MNRFELRPLILVLGSIVLASMPAAAAVDMSGGWNVSAGGGLVECQLSVTQVASALTLSATCPIVGTFNIPGTIDTMTGVFSASGTSSNCATSFTVDGTTNQTSTAFTASYTCNGNPGFSPIDGSRCGNGTLDAGEACDDGNRQSGDCCSSTCTYDPAGRSCTTDNNECTLDVCDGAGTCTHPIAAGIQCTSDGNPCTDDVCSAGGVCQHLANTRPCDDGDPCTLDDTCSGGACTSTVCSLCCDESAGCTPALASSCKATTVPSGPLRFDILGGQPQNQLVWKWKHGEAVTTAELGDPTTSTDYGLCLYRHDQVGVLQLVAHGQLAAAGTCAGRPCWKALGGNGFKYSDPFGLHDGVTQVTIRSGGTGAAKLGVKAKGSHLTYTPAWGPLPVLVELRGSNGVCLGAGFKVAQEDQQVIFGSNVGAASFRARKSSPSGAFVE